MSALPPAPEPSPASVPPPASEPSTVDDAPDRGAAPPAARSVWRSLRLLFWLVLILAAIAAALAGWRLRTDVDQTQSRLEQSERALAAITQQAGKSERDAQLRIERLEADLTRLRDQRSELDLLYMDLTRGRDEAALVEVDRLVNLAAQELQIGANTASAIAALQTADARLARIDRPQLVDLRRAITRDLERLRAAPSVDITGLALKIDQIAQSVDALPLLAEVITRSPAPASASKASSSAAAAPADGTAQQTASDWWTQVRRWLQQEFGDLVRIREVDTPEALLLTGAQQQLARQQLRLRLLNARQALLMRNDRLYRADLAEAQNLIARYFDTRQGATVTAQTQLKQLAALMFAGTVRR
jgi:uroporphyrinogen III methyltransferase / synthase